MPLLALAAAVPDAAPLAAKEKADVADPVSGLWLVSEWGSEADPGTLKSSAKALVSE
jgi:hypothetical protein